jgi:O-antigen/teichoic acid export membrane protein
MASSGNGRQRTTYTRDESVAQRLDRNYNELLQELRVAQTGVQILFAFLLTIAFQSTFAKLNDFQHTLYLATLLSSAAAVIMFIAPVATHRLMFRRGMKDRLVVITNRLAMVGLAFLAFAILGSILLVVDMVAALTAAVVLTVIAALAIVLFWIGMPSYFRRHSPQTEEGDPERDPASIAD